MPFVNDIHSCLNPTEVEAVTEVDSIEAIQSAVRAVGTGGGALSAG